MVVGAPQPLLDGDGEVEGGVADGIRGGAGGARAPLGEVGRHPDGAVEVVAGEVVDEVLVGRVVLAAWGSRHGPIVAGATVSRQCHAGWMSETVVGIGTRKGLWLARSADRREWSVEGPHFLMSEVLSLLFDTRRDVPR